MDYKKTLNQQCKRYFEIAAVASQEAAERYAALKDSMEREKYLHVFWKGRDPTPTTERNERYEEHLRRVQYADIYFKAHNYFWDDRGKIYIKYGEPDYRESNPMGEDLFTNDPFGSSGDEFEVVDNTTGERISIKMSAGTHAWERWTYSRQAQIFSFVQKDMGYYLVKDMDAAKKATAKATLQSFAAIDAALPTLGDSMKQDIYRYDYGQSLDFPFGLARFADQNQTEIWIYSGIPLKNIVFDDTVRQGMLNRSIVIFDPEMTEVGRDDRILNPAVPTGAKDLESALAIDLAKFKLRPGSYEMAISLMDMNSGKNGIYKNKFNVLDYRPGAEESSDMIICSDIQSVEQEGQMVRHGYRLVPQPGHNFKKGRELYYYFELYHLKASPERTCSLNIRYLILSEKNTKARTTVYSVVETRNSELYLAGGIDTEDLNPGDYYIVAEIQETAGGKKKSIIRPFRIIK